jgi:hypothetical protein
MLKQILATTAVLAAVAVSIPAAHAAGFRQLVVEPTGASADDGFLKRFKKPNFLILKNGQGIPTPPKSGAPVANFIVAPGGGIATPTGGAGSGNPGNGGVKNELVVAPTGGIGTPAGGGNPVNPPGGRNELVVASGGGIPTPAGGGANPPGVNAPTGVPTQVASLGSGLADAKPFPALANPSDLTTPAGTDGTDAGAGAAPAADPAGGAPADPSPGADNGNGGAVQVAAAVPAGPAPAIQTPGSLYQVLVAHGYGVDIVKRDARGDLVFYVTTPAAPGAGDLLLVDAENGRVLERKHVAAFAFPHRHVVAYVPDYAQGHDDGCDHGGGY